MKRGFTLIELLVASLLLGLLVSILTSVFSQSSIAWSTGAASVVDLDSSRRSMAEVQTSADRLLDRTGLSVQSVFAGMSGSALNARAYSEGGGSGAVDTSKVDISDPSSWSNISVGGAQNASAQGAVGNGDMYVVGVTSAGPDRDFDTWDDITTWPTDE